MKTVSSRQDLARANQDARTWSRLRAHLHFHDRVERQYLGLIWFYMNSIIWTHDTFPFVLQKFVSVWDSFSSNWEEFIRIGFSSGYIPRSVCRTFFWSTWQLLCNNLEAVLSIYFQRPCSINRGQRNLKAQLQELMLSFLIFIHSTVACICRIFDYTLTPTCVMTLKFRPEFLANNGVTQ